MAVKEHSLDISAKLDMQEMKNAVIQAQKEIDNRYDFKGISKEIDLNVGAKTLTLISSSVIAYRTAAGSANAAEVIAPTIVATLVSTAVGIIACKVLQKLPSFKREEI